MSKDPQERCGGSGKLPTGECRVAMSGPTCMNPDCPPCQHPETEDCPGCPDCSAPTGTEEGCILALEEREDELERALLPFIDAKPLPGGRDDHYRIYISGDDLRRAKAACDRSSLPTTPEPEGDDWPEAIWRIQIDRLINPKALHTDSEREARGWTETGANVRKYVSAGEAPSIPLGDREAISRALKEAGDLTAGLIAGESVSETWARRVNHRVVEVLKGGDDV